MCEAQPIVEFLKLKKLDKNLFGNDRFWVFVGGVGKKMSDNSEKLLAHHQFDKIVNIGTAGVNHKSVEIGTLFCVNRLIDGIETAILQTVSKPQTLSDSPHELTLFDMEGEYFLSVANKYFDPSKILVFKIVSDYLDSKILEKSFVSALVKAKIHKVLENI